MTGGLLQGGGQGVLSLFHVEQRHSPDPFHVKRLPVGHIQATLIHVKRPCT